MMKRSLTLSSLLFIAVTANTSTQSIKFANTDCVTGLNEIGLIPVTDLSDSRQDVEHVIAHKADEQGASWYYITQMYEGQQPGSQHIQAILYV